jgi:hypothetical protein
MLERQLNLFKSKKQRGAAIVHNPTEFAFQCSLADLLKKWARPSWIWTAIPAGEERPAIMRNGVRVSFAGERLARMGAKRGWPDIVLIAPKGHARGGVVHCLELKRKRGGRMSDEQESFRLWCLLNEVPHAVVRDIDEAIAVLGEWDVWRGKVEAQ